MGAVVGLMKGDERKERKEDERKTKLKLHARDGRKGRTGREDRAKEGQGEEKRKGVRKHSAVCGRDEDSEGL